MSIVHSSLWALSQFQLTSLSNFWDVPLHVLIAYGSKDWVKRKQISHKQAALTFQNYTSCFSHTVFSYYIAFACSFSLLSFLVLSIMNWSYLVNMHKEFAKLHLTIVFLSTLEWLFFSYYVKECFSRIFCHYWPSMWFCWHELLTNTSTKRLEAKWLQAPKIMYLITCCINSGI